MPAAPVPASLEKTPRATPHRAASQTEIAVPAAPPAAALGVKAQRTISSRAPGRLRQFPRITARAHKK